MTAKFDYLSSIIGRVGIALLFLPAAHFHLSAAGYESTIKGMVDSKVPFPQLMLWIAMIISSGAVLSVLFSWKAVWGARVLALYSLVVSYVMYDPFATSAMPGAPFFVRDLAMLATLIPPRDNIHLIFFLKDMAIAGGLLAYASALSALTRSRQTAPRPSVAEVEPGFEGSTTYQGKAL